jgi:2-keto-4-pentenoate hydratase/2-oxohepta-3-ene-1,7-dioic acid hydratase in catechol pathway
MTFSLATVIDGATPVAAVKIGDTYRRVADTVPELADTVARRGLLGVFEEWDRAQGLLVEAAHRLHDEPGAVAELIIDPAEGILAPLLYPAKAVFTGFNYYDHVTQDAGRADFDKSQLDPAFFFKPPTTTIVGPGKTVPYPGQTSQFDYEIELAVVIGRRGRFLTMDDALDHVAGYTTAMDLSARDWQKNPRHPGKSDPVGGKAFDFSCPLGPSIVPARFLDGGNLDIRMSVNGELRQDSNTKHMVWSIAEQLVAITQHLTLEPGDIVSTGTPAGVGSKLGKFLRVGDTLRGEISGLEPLEVEIVAERERP